MSRLKVCMAVDATPGSPRLRGRPPGLGVSATPAAARPDSPAASKWVSFSDPLVSLPSQQEQLKIRLGTILLLPCGEVFACPWPVAPSQPPQSTEAPAETAYED
jgi:hypothetical protein